MCEERGGVWRDGGSGLGNDGCWWEDGADVGSEGVNLTDVGTEGEGLVVVALREHATLLAVVILLVASCKQTAGVTTGTTTATSQTRQLSPLNSQPFAPPTTHVACANMDSYGPHVDKQ